MAIDDNIAAEVLAKCGRHCCICRRFRPIRLQVHHIVPSSEGGVDSIDNLIALCMTCHTDVHSKVPFARRFSHTELKQHRDRVYAMVADGTLVPNEDEGELDGVPIAFSSEPEQLRLSSAAVEILTLAAQSTGNVLHLRFIGGAEFGAGNKVLFHGRDPRKEAEYEAGIEELAGNGLLKVRGYEGQFWAVTHQGYLLADELLTLAKKKIAASEEPGAALRSAPA